MTADQFRSLALSMPEAFEGEHMGHPDFRVRGKIFATLGPNEDWGMVKLSADQQAAYVRAEPEVFQAFGGAWGREGGHEGGPCKRPRVDGSRSLDRRMAQHRPGAARSAV